MSRSTTVHFEVPSGTQRGIGLWVESCGAFAAKPAAWTVDDRRPRGYRLLWIERGAGWLETALTRRIAVPPDSLVALFPEVAHRYAPEVWWQERWIEFAGPLAAAFERAGLLDRRRPLLRLHGDLEIPRQFERVVDALREGGPLAGALAASRVHELLVLAHGLRSGLRGGPEDDLIPRAIAWLDTRLPPLVDTEASAPPPADPGAPSVEPIAREPEPGALHAPRPQDVAAALDVGYSTLRRRFKQETGFSIKEYILSAQLRWAKELLVCSSLPVDAIAARVGFRDAFYFSRLFRSREGTSPSEFREHRERGPAAVAIVTRA